MWSQAQEHGEESRPQHNPPSFPVHHLPETVQETGILEPRSFQVLLLIHHSASCGVKGAGAPRCQEAGHGGHEDVSETGVPVELVHLYQVLLQ